MKERRVSELMLERYRLGELLPGDKHSVDETLALDDSLRSRLEKLDNSDRELRILYPFDSLGLPARSAGRRVKKPRPVFLARIAAVIALCILFPAIYYLQSRTASTSRAKGAVPAGYELSVYLKGDREIPLSGKAVLREGNTVQLAYTAPAGDDRYGVIFSVDGRSGVTMHYPYREGQSSLLVSGKRTYLSEAYTLDDAPDYEIFVMVVSGEPLNAETVLEVARTMAEKANKPGQRSQGLKAIIEEESRTAFKGCEVETVTVLKE